MATLYEAILVNDENVPDPVIGYPWRPFSTLPDNKVTAIYQMEDGWFTIEVEEDGNTVLLGRINGNIVTVGTLTE